MSMDVENYMRLGLHLPQDMFANGHSPAEFAA